MQGPPYKVRFSRDKTPGLAGWVGTLSSSFVSRLCKLPQDGGDVTTETGEVLALASPNKPQVASLRCRVSVGTSCQNGVARRGFLLCPSFLSLFLPPSRLGLVSLACLAQVQGALPFRVLEKAIKGRLCRVRTPKQALHPFRAPCQGSLPALMSLAQNNTWKA